ncbi:MAG: polysaccharide deacetylase family protein [Salinivirgaceae bacterium]|nr:polysaccharide deacetylase family protein [Salinivirgaceae bacterium]
MKIVSDISTPRLHYVLDYVFNMRLGVGYELCESGASPDDSAALYYTVQPQPDRFCVPSSGLLAETDVWQFTPDLTFDNGQPVIFADHSGCTFKFDVFAAIFWMLSRYEEYLPFLPDNHGRFSPSESFLGRNGLLETPVVDQWIMLIRNELHLRFPDLQMKDEHFEFRPTIDIDSPWSYLHKGLIRNAGGLVRDAARCDFALVVERILVLLRLRRDPFFTFDYIDEIHRGLPLKYFVLVGRHGKFDKSINPQNRTFRRFVRQLCAKADVGLHPSYAASLDENRFLTEKAYFEQIASVKCNESRQHFLRVVLPQYYQMLERVGITSDYSLGFAANIGFRAGTSRAFKFYDLQNERVLNVTLQPLVMMDVTLRNYMELTPQQASARIKSLVDAIKQANGTFTTLWHNQHFGQPDWREWNQMYVDMLGSLR